MTTKQKSPLHKLTLRTSRRTELKNVTDQIEKIVRESRCASGVCHLYVPHTTAAVLINEGYDPDVARDMEVAFDRMVPHKGDYRHAEGNSDSHTKTALDLYNEMLAIYPERVNPAVLWYSAQAVKPGN